MTVTRPDLSYIVTKHSQKMFSPTIQDISVVKGAHRYLRDTMNYLLVFTAIQKI